MNTIEQHSLPYLKAAIFVLAALLAPVRPVIIATTCLVFADLVTGLMRAKKCGEPITAWGLRRTLVKTAVYLASIILGFVTETWLMGGFLPVTKIISGAIGVVELKSCLENLSQISGRDVLKVAIDKIAGPPMPTNTITQQTKVQVEVKTKEG